MHRRKPVAKDPVHPTKADFIRAKYQNLAFTRRLNTTDADKVLDLSRQLHSCVRTDNLGEDDRTNDDGIQREEGVKSVAPPSQLIPLKGVGLSGQRGVTHEDTFGAIGAIFRFWSRS